MKYEPIELQAGPSDWRGMRQNPSRGFDPYAGLEIRLAIVRHPDYDAKKKVSITCSQDVHKLVAGMSDEVVESMLVLIMDSKHRVIAVYVATRGQVDQTTVEPADLFRAVLVAGQKRFIVVHNHPSGSASPSESDRELTARLVAAAEVLGLVLLDHVIVGLDEHYSFASSGEIPTGRRGSTLSVAGHR